jgi:hypothetical protein
MTSTMQAAATTRGTAIAVTVGFAGIALFQFGLALGAPLGRAAWGGTIPGQLPAGLRVASLFAVPIWVLAALVILGRVGIGPLPPAAWPVWVLFGLLLLTTLMNLISRSPWERYLWSPYALVLAVLTAVVARS